MSKNNLKDDEIRGAIITILVKDGFDTGIAGPVPGYLINRLEDVIEQIYDWKKKYSISSDEVENE